MKKTITITVDYEDSTHVKDVDAILKTHFEDLARNTPLLDANAGLVWQQYYIDIT